MGNTYRNLEGFNVLNAVEADRLVKEHSQLLSEQRLFGLQGDGFHDKSRKPQEATNTRIVDKTTGIPQILGLCFTKLRHQDASACREAMFGQLKHHGVSKVDAQKKMVSVGVDGASVNLGKFAGMKALITKSPGDVGTKPGLDYWGWDQVCFLHCVNHLEELSILDLKDADPYVREFDEHLKKIFSI